MAEVSPDGAPFVFSLSFRGITPSPSFMLAGLSPDDNVFIFPYFHGAFHPLCFGRCSAPSRPVYWFRSGGRRVGRHGRGSWNEAAQRKRSTLASTDKLPATLACFIFRACDVHSLLVHYSIFILGKDRAPIATSTLARCCTLLAWENFLESIR